MKKKLKVLLVFDVPEAPPSEYDFAEEFKLEDRKAEAHIQKALQELGHDVKLLGIFDDVAPILETVKRDRPDIIFNSTDSFNNQLRFEPNIVGLFELLGVPYTGTSSHGLTLCKNKSIAKKIFSYHRIKTPAFHVVELGDRVRPPQKIKYPVLIKPLHEEASYGISQKSLVDNDTDFMERIRFVHESMNRDALYEEYVAGRELYVSVLGETRLQVLAFRELVFEYASEDDPKIATFKAKWDENYRKKYGIKNRFALPLAEGLPEKIAHICKKVFRSLYMCGYGRIDLRLTPENEVVVLEANPNPFIANDEDFSMAAQKAGIEYADLIQKILAMGLKQHKKAHS
jgi:D-alanine-D-alanine ligase